MPHYTFVNLPKNLPLLIKLRSEEVPQITLQASKNADGIFEYFSYSSVYSDVLSLAWQFKKLGIKKGENVAFISDNCREWLLTDYALLSLGAVDVPRGCDSMGNEIRFIISFADCKFGVFENQAQVEKVLQKIEEVPLLKTVIVFRKMNEKVEELVKGAGLKLIYFDQLLETARNEFNGEKEKITEEIEDGMQNIQSDDNATIIFTSGTTGTPKGVMLTHGNYMSQLSVIHNFLPARAGDMWLSVLPVWHSFERLIQYVAPVLKNGLAYSKPVGQILLSDMAVIKPTWMCGVPRLWEAIAKGVKKAVQKKGGLSLKLFNFFVKIGGLYADQKDKVLGHVCRIKKRNKAFDFVCGLIPFCLLFPLKKLGDVLIFSKLRQKFGGKLSVAISGGGALQKDIDDFYRAVGLNLLEGYGLTETCPVISFRNPKEPRPGCVGAIFPTMEVKILKEEHGVVIDEKPLPPGECGLIFVRSKQVMKGYYKRPDLTEKVIDKNGWFNTGDLGIRTWDEELKITGRAKDTIVLLDGENIEPAVIEAELLTSDFIESVMVTGQDKKYLGALIVPYKDAVENFAKEEGIEYSSYEELLKNPKITKLFEEIVSNSISHARGFRICEKIYKIALLPKSFEVGIELSAKQEMMRYKIEEIYADIIKGLFE
ncbi:AMP-dependent synthetase/ligase [Treponema pectinovorum]|uniref:AMP-dependent synthetase/ligase n=1 Tax=Treponema pectinovorum TaxID=164 RepID=UPI003D8D85DC